LEVEDLNGKKEKTINSFTLQTQPLSKIPMQSLKKEFSSIFNPFSPIQILNIFAFLFFSSKNI